MSERLVFTETIQASPALVYRAFTNASALRLWLCDQSYVDAREGGCYLASWNVGFHAAGRFTKLEPGRTVAFTWQGSNEPGTTQVTVTLASAGESTRLELVHEGIGSGEAWEKAARDLSSGWESGLPNLKYLLEAGLDARLMRRPMLGIYPQPLTAESATRLGVPVAAGTHLSGVVEGTGAAAAGLQADDVIVTLAGKPVHDFSTVQAALSGYHGGDTVTVEFYRGGEKYTVDMSLSKRPMPDYPMSPAGLAEVVQANNSELIAELHALFESYPEAVLAQRPQPDEWSANENIAHLIWTERHAHMTIWSTVGGEDNVPWPDNGPLHQVGTMAVFPSSPALAAEYRRTKAATVAMVAALPEDLATQNPYGYHQIAQLLTLNPRHDRQHFAQMRAAIEANQVEALA